MPSSKNYYTPFTIFSLFAQLSNAAPSYLNSTLLRSSSPSSITTSIVRFSLSSTSIVNDETSINASAAAAASSEAQASFDGSPQCTASWLSVLAKGGGLTTEVYLETLVVSGHSVTVFDIDDASHRGITLTGPTTTVYTETPFTYSKDLYDACCGQCSVFFQSVDVFYWPAASSNTACLTSIDPYYSTHEGYSPVDTRTAANAQPTTARAALPLNGSQSFTVAPDGFTYLSPYAYVKFPIIEAGNQCGPVGGKYTSVTWSFAPGQLSTVEGRGGPTKVFNFADLPCPPASVASADWYNYKPGQPYAPIIAPVPQLFQLDPTFANCGVDIYEGYDPPHALTPAAALTPFTTPAAPGEGTSSTIAPAPQSQIASSGPVQTTLSLSTPPINTKPGLVAASSDDPHYSTSSFSSATKSPAQFSLGSYDHNPAAQTSSIPGLANTAAGASPTTLPSSQAIELPLPYSTTPSNSPIPNLDVTIGGHPISVGPSGVFIGTNTIQPGGTALTIAGTPVSLDPSAIMIGTSTLSYQAFSLTQPIRSITVADQIVSPNPTDFSIADTTLLPNAPAITISGTPISLNPSAIIIGSTAIPFSPGILPTTAIITLAGQTFAPNPTAITIANNTLFAGGPALTFSGTPISLDPSGLIIGSTQTFQFASPSPSSYPSSLLQRPARITFTADEQTFTAAVAAASGFPIPIAVGGTTLLPGGPALTLSDGDPISLDLLGSSGGSDEVIVIGSSTIPVPVSVAWTPTTSGVGDGGGIGGIIMSGFGVFGGVKSATMTTTTTTIGLATGGSAAGGSATGVGTQNPPTSTSTNISPIVISSSVKIRACKRRTGFGWAVVLGTIISLWFTL